MTAPRITRQYDLHSDEGMADALDDILGTGKWVFDPDADVWIALDSAHTGPPPPWQVAA